MGNWFFRQGGGPIFSPQIKAVNFLPGLLGFCWYFFNWGSGLGDYFRGGRWEAISRNIPGIAWVVWLLFAFLGIFTTGWPGAGR